MRKNVAQDLGQNGLRIFDPRALELHVNVPLRCFHLKEKHSVSLPILSNHFCLRRRGEENIKMNREEIGWGGGGGGYMVWINLGQERGNWWDVVNTVMSFGVLYSARNFLTAVHNNNNSNNNNNNDDDNNNNNNSNNRVEFIFRCSGLPTG